MTKKKKIALILAGLAFLGTACKYYFDINPCEFKGLCEAVAEAIGGASGI